MIVGFGTRNGEIWGTPPRSYRPGVPLPDACRADAAQPRSCRGPEVGIGEISLMPVSGNFRLARQLGSYHMWFKRSDKIAGDLLTAESATSRPQRGHFSMIGFNAVCEPASVSSSLPGLSA